MNDLAREKLVAAALNGVPQARGVFRMGKAYCALGVLGWSREMTRDQWVDSCYEHGLSLDWDFQCPVGRCEVLAGKVSEPLLIQHLNDTHGWDFLQIARKLGGA